MNASHPHSKVSLPNILLLAIVLVVLVCLPFLATPNSKTLFSFPKFKADVESPDLVAPFTENRKFKYVTLPNQMKFLLISDSETVESACSVKVSVGSQDEPEGLNGLAHFLEHMLFEGSEKYPGSYFSDFVSKYNGVSNAFTMDDSTTYYFKLANSGFADALDIFAHFFIDASLDPDMVDKEINAVNSEYEIDLQKNSWRFMELLRKLARKDSSYHRFSIGNIRTLKEIPSRKNISISDELRKFYESLYTPEKMQSTIISNLSLQEMEDLLTPIFSLVPQRQNINNTVNAAPSSPVAYWKEDLNKMVWYKTLNNKNELNIVFVLNFTTPENIFTRSIDYITDLLNAEGDNGLKAFMIKSGYVVNMAVGPQPCNGDFFMYMAQFDLTSDGMNNVMDVINMFYGFIGKIKKEGVDRKIYDEKSLISYINFMYKEKDTVENDVVNMLGKMNLDFNKILVGGEVYMNYDEKIIQQMLDSFIPENSLIVVGSGYFDIADIIQKVSFKDQSKGPNFKFIQTEDLYNDFMEYMEIDDLKRLKSDKDNQEKKGKLKKTHRFAVKKPEINEKMYADPLFLEANLNQHKRKATRSEQDVFDNLYGKKLNKYEENMKIYYTLTNLDEGSKQNMTKYLNNPKDILPDNIEVYSYNRFIPDDLNLVSETCVFKSNQNKRKYQQRILRENNFTSPINSLITNHYKLFGSPLDADCFDKELNQDHNKPIPDLIKQDNNTEIWLKTDRSYLLPFTLIDIQFFYPQAKSCIYENMILKLLAMKIGDITTDFIDAKDLGYQIGVNPSPYGLNLDIYGFSDKIGKIVNMMQEQINQIALNETDFENAKTLLFAESFIDMVNVLEPIELAQKILKQILDQTKSVDFSDVSNLLSLSYENFTQTYNNFKSSVKIRGSIYGNILRPDALSLANKISSFLSPYSNTSSDCQLNNKVTTLEAPSSKSLVYRAANPNSEDTNNAIVNYYQIAGFEKLNEAKIQSFLGLFNSQSFEYLRTQRQLGYVVFANPVKARDVIGIGVFVEGSAKNPLAMDEEIEGFLSYFADYLKNADQSSLDAELDSGIENYTKTTFAEKGFSYWTKIVEGKYWNENGVPPSIDKKDIIDFYDKVFRTEQRKISIQIFANKNDNSTLDILNNGITLDKEKSYGERKEEIVRSVDDFGNMTKIEMIDRRMAFYGQ